MSALTTVNSGGSAPTLTVRGANLIIYSCSFRLWKPEGQVWPETGERDKVIHTVTLNQDHPPTDTFTLPPPAVLRNMAGITWDIDMIVPGGGGPLHYSVSVEINQDGSSIMDPVWQGEGQITTAEAEGGDTLLRVAP